MDGERTGWRREAGTMPPRADHSTTILKNKMPERTEWEGKAKAILRAEMARKGMTCAHLFEGLAAIGIEDKERNLRNKVGREKFTAGFLLQCLSAIGVCSLLRG